MHWQNASPDNRLPAQERPPRVKVPRLTSIAAVRRELGRQYGMHLRGEIGNKALVARVRTLVEVRACFLVGEYDQRLRAVEQKLENRSA